MSLELTTTPNSLDDIETRLKKSKNLKIVCIAICEMGHFIPMSHIAEELKDRGHEVHVITNNYNKDRCSSIINAFGGTIHVTNDTVKSE